jgi:hypothetical protein
MPGTGKLFLSITSRQALEHTQNPIRKSSVAIFPGVKRQGSEADHLHLIPRLIMVEQYLHSPICLYVMVLNNEI